MGQFELSEPPSDVISAVKFAPGSSTRLLVSSWDRHVYLYDTHEESGGKLIAKFEHRAPVLDVCWGKDENEAFSAGLDWDVKRINLETGEQTVLSSHGAGVKSVVYSLDHKVLVSASWDSTLHIHFPSKPSHTPNTIHLPNKPFSLSSTETKLVVAMAARAVNIYDLKSLALLASQSSQGPPNNLEVEPWQRRESSMKFMTRAVACMPDDAGYASSSIEGRIAVEWFDPSEQSQARKYAFKCHRQQQDGVDVVYPVNALTFHPVHGTFASGGGDGVVALWDGLAKRRIRQYQRYNSSIASLSFSSDGKYLAVGISPGFEDAKNDVVDGVVKVFIREMGEAEAKGKGAK
ncbi:WD40 repeat-like protein [Rhizodiscina lignyota]|uniref:WD40 repeat-like protein n=1 Tax=Rhizodiscina lignyota TaxID=1504668 RepID=A0A9P4IPU6_9PEZI|nr:WD40 repeat-like protein [Rhizodiscina lignyota]